MMVYLAVAQSLQRQGALGLVISPDSLRDLHGREFFGQTKGL
jgi:hypothetical protein